MSLVKQSIIIFLACVLTLAVSCAVFGQGVPYEQIPAPLEWIEDPTEDPTPEKIAETVADMLAYQSSMYYDYYDSFAWDETQDRVAALIAAANQPNAPVILQTCLVLLGIGIDGQPASGGVWHQWLETHSDAVKFLSYAETSKDAYVNMSAPGRMPPVDQFTLYRAAKFSSIYFGKYENSRQWLNAQIAWDGPIGVVLLMGGF